MKIVGIILGGLALIGSVIAGVIASAQIAIATFTAVTAFAVPIIVAYFAAAIVFSNLSSIVVGLAWGAIALLCGLMESNNSRTQTICA